MFIGLLRHDDSPNQQPYSFVDDLDSVFCLFFYTCLHTSGAGGRGFDKVTPSMTRNFQSLEDLGTLKAGGSS